jgi:hypothetical protein
MSDKCKNTSYANCKCTVCSQKKQKTGDGSSVIVIQGPPNAVCKCGKCANQRAGAAAGAGAGAAERQALLQAQAQAQALSGLLPR